MRYTKRFPDRFGSSDTVDNTRFVEDATIFFTDKSGNRFVDERGDFLVENTVSMAKDVSVFTDEKRNRLIDEKNNFLIS